MIGPRPGALTPRPYTFPATETLLLTNGMRVVVAPLRRVPIATVLYTVRAGATDEAAADAGCAQLTALALAEGTASQHADDLAVAFESLGGELHTGALWTHAEAGVTVLVERVSQAMEQLAAVIRSPAFPDDGVERLRAERLAELLQQRAEPRGLADDLFAEVCCGADDRNAWPAGGSPETVERLTPSSVHELYARHYTPERSLLIVAGDVDPASVGAMAERVWSGWSANARGSSARAGTAPPEQAVVIAHRDGAPQTELRVGHRSVQRTHQDFHALSMMNAILGGLFNSRINLNLREAHAYTYGAFSTFDWRRDASLFEIATAVKTDITGVALVEILREIDRIRNEQVTLSELTLARDYLVGVFPLRFETTAAIADAMAFRHHYELPESYYDDYRDRMAAITADDILRVARTHLQPEALQIVAVGDASAIQDQLAAVSARTPRVVDR